MRHLLLLLLLPLAATVAAEPCRPVEGLAPLLEPKAVVLFGELHGTAEAPAFVGNALCLAVEAGRAVTLALEVPHEERGRFSAFLASDGGEAARAALLDGAFWTRPFQDGRGSQAMLELVDAARRLRQAGKKVEVFLFDAAEPTRSRDLEMSNRLRAAIEAAPQRLFLVITGNFHSQLTKGREGYPAFVPMGFYLRDGLSGRRVVALDILYAGGSAWICQSPTECGESAVKGVDRGTEWKVTAGAAPIERGHHGHFYLGAIHASPPAAAKPSAKP